MDEKQRYIILKKQLQSIYEDREASHIASMVMEHVTGKNRTDRLMSNHLLDEKMEHRIAYMEQRLLQHEPVQYVIGEAYFYKMKLAVDKGVLIPRPETEELVEWVIETVKNKPQPEERNYKVLDVGTGSGCIPVALQKNLPAYFEIWACDISGDALNIARKNADDQQALIDFIQLDFLDEKQRLQLPHIDILVSNPPYIPLREKEKMSPNVVQYEPAQALFVPDNDPLLFYKALAAFGIKNLHPGGFIFVETHEDLANQTLQMLKDSGYKEILLRQDMQGKNRMLRAQKMD